MSADSQSAEAPHEDCEQRSVSELQEALGSELTVKGTLGKGSVSTVYLAKEGDLGRLVAVKVLSPGNANDPTAQRRFAREAKAVGLVIIGARVGCGAGSSVYAKRDRERWLNELPGATRPLAEILYEEHDVLARRRRWRRLASTASGGC